MKTIILNLIIVAMIFAACNNGENKQVAGSTDTAQAKDQIQTSERSPLSDMLKGYLDVKNALAKDSDKDAATAATQLAKALGSIDKRSLNQQGVNVYEDIEADAKEHAEHIASNVGNLVHQREHFDMLSEEVYELVKAAGAGQKLYYTNCPMYNDNKGANWLSETRTVSNPYLGQEMPTCGSVKEELN